MTPARTVTLALIALALFLGFALAKQRADTIKHNLRGFGSVQAQYRNQLGRIAWLEQQGARTETMSSARSVCHTYAFGYNMDAMSIPDWHFRVAGLPDTLDEKACSSLYR